MSISEIDVASLASDPWHARVERLRNMPGAVMQSRYRRKDGSTLNVEISARHIFVHEKEYVVAVARDATTRLQMEEELRKTSTDLMQAGKLAAISQLAAGLCHELNQPLAATRSYVDNARLLLERGKHALVADNLEQVVALLERASEITRQLKILTRKPPDRRESVPMCEIIATVLTFLSPRVEAENVTVKTVFPKNELYVRADKIRLEQVFMNLLANAFDAMQRAGRPEVVVRVTARKDTVSVSFKDAGTGISKDVLPKLFEPFFSFKDTGLGLGLPISLSIVQDYGGTIKATNSPRGGAVFTVTLPRDTSDGR